MPLFHRKKHVEPQHRMTLGDPIFWRECHFEWVDETESGSTEVIGAHVKIPRSVSLDGQTGLPLRLRSSPENALRGDVAL